MLSSLYSFADPLPTVMLVTYRQIDKYPCILATIANGRQLVTGSLRIMGCIGLHEDCSGGRKHDQE